MTVWELKELAEKNCKGASLTEQQRNAWKNALDGAKAQIEIMKPKQLSLFDNLEMSKEQFADRICEEFNSIDTIWKGGFYVKDLSLTYWEHVKLKNKVLEIHIDSKKNKKNKFIYFDGDEKSQTNLYNIPFESEFIGKLNKDKDFSINITPWSIYIYYHNWELKKI